MLLFLKQKNEVQHRLVGDEDMHRGLLDREHLKTADGVFQRYVEAPLHQGSSECVPPEVLSIYPDNKKKSRWTSGSDGRAADVHPQRRAKTKPSIFADVAQENAGGQTRKVELLGPNAQATRDRWNATQVSNHERLFPFSDNSTTLIFTVASDLSEAQRETQVPFSSGNACHRFHFLICKNSVCGIVLYAEKLNGNSFTPGERTRQQHEHNFHRGRLC